MAVGVVTMWVSVDHVDEGIDAVSVVWPQHSLYSCCVCIGGVSYFESRENGWKTSMCRRSTTSHVHRMAQTELHVRTGFSGIANLAVEQCRD